MNAFTLYPAIDMRNGKCVRLIQGDYGKETIYGDSPLDMAAQFAQEGAEWIHLVDLDGAKAGRKVNDRHVLDIARQLDVKVEIGGGIRSEADVYGYLSQGVDRVILGSSAVSDPAFVKSMLKQYGGKIAIGLDARNGYVSTEGWLETSSVRAADLAVSWRRKERKPSFSRILQLTACCQDRTSKAPFSSQKQREKPSSLQAESAQSPISKHWPASKTPAYRERLSEKRCIQNNLHWLKRSAG